MKKLIALSLVIFSSALFAAPPPPPPSQSGGQGQIIDAPTIPGGMQDGEAIEPGVTIIQTRSERIYEYRVAGRLYMVRVVPRVGPPYYFYDHNGDGQLEYQVDDPRVSKVNQWELFRW